jgi:methylenetetrahydrofolate dehydrogenase (NADP+)/methenyltetrahydrofolate cyclohydrolase
VTARIIDGKAVAAAIRAGVKTASGAVAAKLGRRPGLAVVLVGDDKASAVYVRNKLRETEAADMRSIEFRLDAATAEAELLARIAALNADDTVDGILVQLPLPRHIDAQKVIAAIDPAKDVDGFHPLNAGRLAIGAPGLAPCTPLGCVMLAKSAVPSLVGAEVVVVGRSSIVGKPVALLMLREDATVTLAHSRTRDLPAVCRRADVLIVAVGRTEMLRGAWIRPGATVIDVGINQVSDASGKTRLKGDVHFEEAKAVAGAITPVPGGVGPMTIACLLRNTFTALALRKGLTDPLAG